MGSELPGPALPPADAASSVKQRPDVRPLSDIGCASRCTRLRLNGGFIELDGKLVIANLDAITVANSDLSFDALAVNFDAVIAEYILDTAHYSDEKYAHVFGDIALR